MEGSGQQISNFFPQRKGFAISNVAVVFGMVLVLGAAWVMISGCPTSSSGVPMTQYKLDAINGVLEEYKKIGGVYPSQEQGLRALVEQPSTAPVSVEYSQLYIELPLDAWDNEFKYLNPGTQDPTRPEVISSGADGQFGTDDDLSSQW